MHSLLPVHCRVVLIELSVFGGQAQHTEAVDVVDLRGFHRVALDVVVDHFLDHHDIWLLVRAVDCGAHCGFRCEVGR